MPGPNRAPRGGYQKPKDLGKTISRLLGYLTRSKLPLMAVFGCLLISVFTNIGGSYMMRASSTTSSGRAAPTSPAWAGLSWSW